MTRNNCGVMLVPFAVLSALALTPVVRACPSLAGASTRSSRVTYEEVRVPVPDPTADPSDVVDGILLPTDDNQ